MTSVMYLQELKTKHTQVVKYKHQKSQVSFNKFHKQNRQITL